MYAANQNRLSSSVGRAPEMEAVGSSPTFAKNKNIPNPSLIGGTLDELLDEHVGKKGTEVRTKFDNKVNRQTLVFEMIEEMKNKRKYKR